MEQGPLPPHERTWRHPSELAAEERDLLRAETAPMSARLLALATGAVGLAVVGVLVMSVTPRRLDGPIAISVTTTPVLAISSSAGSPPDGARIAAAAGNPDATPTVSSVVTVRHPVEALATPIGTGRFAFVTRSAAGISPEQPFNVRLPSGRLGTGRMINEISDALIVELDIGEPGHPIAQRRPRADDIVTVMDDPPVTIAYDDVDTLQVSEGVAIIDDDGALVGICSHDEDGTLVIEVTDESVADAERADAEPVDDEWSGDDQVSEAYVAATTVAP